MIQTDRAQEVMDVIAQAATEMDESSPVSSRWHRRTSEMTSVRAVLTRLKEGTIQLPLCQRLYVWGKEHRLSLWDTIRDNASLGTIILAEHEGVLYLVDGLQRLTSCMYLSVDHDEVGMTEAEKNEVLNYTITIETVYDMSLPEIKNYFGRLNSGIALAAVVKARSKLSDRLNSAVLALSSNPYFREADTKITFNKGHHHEIIAMNALLAAAGIGIVDNKAASLCKTLQEYEDDVLNAQKKAQALIDRLISVFKGLDTALAKRALSANFASVLLHVMAKEECTDVQLAAVIQHIFAGRKAIPEYSATTRSQAADAKKCLERYQVIVSLLGKVGNTFDSKSFESWKSSSSVLKTKGGEIVDIAEFSDFDLRSLYTLQKQGKTEEYDQFVAKKYHELEIA